jgi:AraC family transcriptional regulator, regulatory protein of adaptative response / methylated-DNA-[protein]-cysteine methyltransferase
MGGDYERVEGIIRYLSESARARVGLEELAALSGLGQDALRDAFRKWAGLSPKDFLQALTLERAKERLRAGRSTLDAALDSGLSGNGRLQDLFIKLEACSPGEFARRGEGLCLRYHRFETIFGPALAAETDRGLCHLSFLGPGEDALARLAEDLPLARLEPGPGPFALRVRDFFSSWRSPKEGIPLDLRGTPFQVAVWRALLRIPEGACLSYGDIAKEIGRPRAGRAVGTAVGMNPVAYLIPCHRVIRDSGAIGEYRWGRERKLAMLGFEGAREWA